MARYPDVRYVQFYTAGSAARKLEIPTPFKTERKPKVRKQSKAVVRIDPLAALGVATAAVMLILMLVGLVRLQAAKQEYAVMEQYVESLQAENKTLQQAYDSGYDIEEVERTALALGMVPAEQVQQIPIQVSVVETEPETVGFWDRVSAFLTGLFA